MGSLLNRRDEIIPTNIMDVARQSNITIKTNGYGKIVKEGTVFIQEYNNLVRGYFLSIVQVWRESYSNIYFGGNIYFIAKDSKEWADKKKKAREDFVNNLMTKKV